MRVFTQPKMHQRHAENRVTLPGLPVAPSCCLKTEAEFLAKKRFAGLCGEFGGVAPDGSGVEGGFEGELLGCYPGTEQNKNVDYRILQVECYRFALFSSSAIFSRSHFLGVTDEPSMTRLLNFSTDFVSRGSIDVSFFTKLRKLLYSRF